MIRPNKQSPNRTSFPYLLLSTLLCVFIYVHTSFAESKDLDSLRALLRSQELSEMERYDIAIKYAGGHMRSDFSRAIQMADSLYALFKEYPVLRARAVAIRAQAVSGEIDSDTALAILEEAFALCSIKASPEYYAKFINLKGVLIAQKGGWFEAKKYFERAIFLHDSVGEYGRKASAITDLAAVYGNLGQSKKSAELYFQSLKLAEETKRYDVVALALSNIGVEYHKEGKLDTARMYYERAMNKYKRIKSIHGELQMIRFIGIVFHAQNQLDSARALYEKSLELAIESNSIADITDCKIRLGELAVRLKDYDEAERLMLETFQLVMDAGMKREQAIIARNLGDMNGKRGDFKKAIEWCHKSLAIADELKSLEHQRLSCACLRSGYKAIGDYKQAFEYQTRVMNHMMDQKQERALLTLQQQEYQRKAMKDSVAVVAEKLEVEQAHKDAIRRKNNARNLALGGGGAILLLAVGLWSRLRYTRKTKAIIEKEKDRSEELLLNILPSEVAEELKEKGESEARMFDDCTVIFTDFKGFTALAEELSPKELVQDLILCFSEFDKITAKYGIEKIKTIGDSYMAAGGLPVPNDTHAADVVKAAFKMRDFVEAGKAKKIEAGLPYFEIRIGIHTGPVVAGIVGVKKFQYDIWGDTVNTASRMESSGEVGKVNISQSTYELIKDDPDFVFENRGKIEAKGKGEMEMYFVTN